MSALPLSSFTKARRRPALAQVPEAALIVLGVLLWIFFFGDRLSSAVLLLLAFALWLMRQFSPQRDNLPWLLFLAAVVVGFLPVDISLRYAPGLPHLVAYHELRPYGAVESDEDLFAPPSCCVVGYDHPKYVLIW